MFANEPQFEAPRFDWWRGATTSSSTVFAVEDRVTIAPGFWLEPGVAVVLGRATNRSVDLRRWALLPQIAGVWDLEARGGPVVRGGIHDRVNLDLPGFAAHAQGEPFYRQCRFNEATNRFTATAPG